MSFDPNAASEKKSGIFGLPSKEANAKIIFIPVPWEATTSYGGGTSKGPSAIFEASKQVDLFDLELGDFYEAGLFMLPESANVKKWNKEAKAAAKKKSLKRVNELGHKINDFVFTETRRVLEAGKIPAIVGGDHSVPFGAFQAIAEKYPSYGILHFDAHSDTRKAFEGFTWSHASIFHNVLEKIPACKKLVQVGIRDFCEEEFNYCRSQKERVKTYYDLELSQRKYRGETWEKIVSEIISELPENVWISFDIDGLDPRFCPNTGTPVPGGLDFNEALFIISTLAKSGRKIIGFDLNEVAPDPSGASEWDANVGARLLYKMAGWCLKSWG